MAKSKPSKEGAVKKKRSGVMHSANELAPPYDPALALLFASSVRTTILGPRPAFVNNYLVRACGLDISL